MPIDWVTLAAAFLAGLVGSVHCVAMCGGIATGFAPRGVDAGAALRAAVITNLGRASGYALAGAIVGGFGHGLVALFRAGHLMYGLRALAGVVLIVVALRMLGLNPHFGAFGRLGETLWASLGPIRSRLLPASTTPRRFALGMVWGWLPCGLSGTMLAAAWLQANAAGGAALMAAFGLGTFPAMLPLSWSGSRWRASAGHRRLAGILVLAAGLLTVAAPWLMQIPALHDLLGTLGCLSSQG